MLMTPSLRSIWLRGNTQHLTAVQPTPALSEVVACCLVYLVVCQPLCFPVSNVLFVILLLYTNHDRTLLYGLCLPVKMITFLNKNQCEWILDSGLVLRRLKPFDNRWHSNTVYLITYAVLLVDSRAIKHFQKCTSQASSQTFTVLTSYIY